jgi:hypothetical protein
MDVVWTSLNIHSFTLSRYDRNDGNWELEKAPVHHIID